MSKCWHLLDRVLMGVGGVSLLLLTVECTVNIVGRYFRKPIEGSYDILSLGMVFLIASSFLPVELSRGHVVVGSVFRKLFKGDIARKIYDTFLCLIDLCAVLWLAWAVLDHLVGVSIPGNEKAMTLLISCYPFRLVWALGLILLAFGIIRRTVNTIRNGKEE